MSDDAIFCLCLAMAVCVPSALSFFKPRRQRRTEITITKTIGDSSVSETTVTTEDL